MAHKSSLMEWLEQTKRLAKEIDYLVLDTIDSIVTALPLIHPHTIRDNKEFFDSFCIQYHKPNPIDMIAKRQSLLKPSHCKDCPSKKKCNSIMGKYVETSIARCKKAVQVITWQWFEIIDFMFERPELINPALIDGYITEKITEVCAKNKKINPLVNGIGWRFGKYWKDNNGNWKKERRKRF